MATANREMNALIGQVLERLDDMSKQIAAMLPREIYEVRHGQIVTDTQELTQRVTVLEKAVVEVNSQLATTRLAATQQINTESRAVERKVDDTKHEITDKMYDLVKSGFFIVLGAVASYLVYHLPH